MIKTFTKRTLALLLCVLMLVSCWVFTAPTASAATAGSYYVEIDVKVNNADAYDRTYVGPYFSSSNADGYKDQGGITLFYKDNNGTKTETANNATIDWSTTWTGSYKNDPIGTILNQTVFDHQKYKSYGFGKNDTVPLKKNGSITTAKHNIIGSTGTYTIADTITGFPTSFAVYNNNDNNGVWGAGAKVTDWEVREIRVYANSSSDSYIKIFEGACRTRNSNGDKPSRYIVNFDGSASIWNPTGAPSAVTDDWDTGYNTEYQYVYNTYLENGNLNTNGNNVLQCTDNYGTYNSAYKKSWEAPEPVIDINGEDSVSVNTDGLTTNSFPYTIGTVKDQYGVDWYQDAYLDGATTQNGVEFSNGTLNVPATSNRADDYSVTLYAVCGLDTSSKTVNINTFDYNVNFYDEDGTTLLDTKTVDYGQMLRHR